MKKVFQSNIKWLIAAVWVYTLTFVFNNYWSKYASYKNVTQSLVKSIQLKEKAFDNFTKDGFFLERMLNNTIDDKDLTLLNKSPFYVYLFEYTNDYYNLKYWSNGSVIPENQDLPVKDSTFLLKTGNGDYVCIFQKKIINDKKVGVVGLIQLRQKYFIENDKLSINYPGFKGLKDYLKISESPTPFPFILSNGTTLCYFQATGKEPIYVFNWPSFIVECLSVLLMLIFIGKTAKRFFLKNYELLSLGFIMLCLVLLRFLILKYQFPIRTTELLIFKPLANNSLFPVYSLGELLLDSIFLYFLINFIHENRKRYLTLFQLCNNKMRWIKTIFFAIIIIAFHFFCILALRGLILNNGISFNVSNFFNLDYTTIISFLILFLLVYSHYKIVNVFAYIMQLFKFAERIVLLFVVSLVGLLSLVLFFKSIIITYLLIALPWLIVLLCVKIFSFKQAKFSVSKSLRFIVWMMFYSLSLTFLFSTLINIKNNNQMFELATKLIAQTDDTNQNEFNLASTGIYINQLANSFDELNIEAKNLQIKDSIKSKYFSGYLRRFDTKIYFFNVLEDPLYNQDSLSFDMLNTFYTQQASSTPNKNSIFFEDSFDKINYLYKNTILNTDSLIIGYVFVLSRPTQYKNEPIYPELFKQLKKFRSDPPSEYSYAIYYNNQIIHQYKNYGFNTQLTATEIPKQQFNFIDKESAKELWIKDGKRVIGVALRNNLISNFTTLFAWIFLAILLLFFIDKSVKLLFTKQKWNFANFKIAQLNIREQLQGAILFITIFSFVIIGVVTISFFINRYKKSMNDQMATSIQNTADELKSLLPINFANLAEHEKKLILNNGLAKLTENLNADINCYDTTGKIFATTQPIIFEKKIISNWVNATAFHQLKHNKKNIYLQPEKIGTLAYNSIYIPAFDKEKVLFGYLQVPSFASDYELKQEINNFLVALINLNLFIFLLAGAISLVISSRITQSFSMLAQKMQEVQLEKPNEPVLWEKNDEIGDLVKQYNKMVEQLQISAGKLAQTERENAWREMAKQVAHEIKNPLTPMKLSLQYLQKAVKDGSENVPQLTEQVSNILVEQINHLSKIASDFSQFANISLPNAEIFDLHPIIDQVLQLHKNHKGIKITWANLQQTLLINADKTQMNRLFTNLIQNAYEACEDNDKAIIEVTEKMIEKNTVLITISDNGGGIPTDVQTKIFAPNFTTKTSGTGLGLAISKDIVENANGKIWFDTKEAVGTIFYIELPVLALTIKET